MDSIDTEQQLVIRPKRSLKKRAAKFFLYLGVFFSSIYVAHFFGYKNGTIGNEARILELAELTQKYTNLTKENSELTFELAKLDQFTEVQKAAYRELERTYEIVEEKNEFLNRRVNFYRSILSPEDGISGLRIHAVKLTESTEDRLDFEVILIQSINHQRKAKVNLHVELFDSKIAKNPLTDWKSPSNVLEFSYSETVNGSLILDQGFRGKFVKITAIPENGSSKQLVEWHEI